MTEPTIVCPKCKGEIKLTESLAAPLIESTKLQYEKRFAEQVAEVSKREQALKSREESVAKAKENLDAAVAEKLKAEREKIATDATKLELKLKEREASLLKEKESVEATVAEKLKSERVRIADEEAKKIKRALGNELEQKSKAVAELTEVLKQKDEKLTEAANAQAELVRKERELADARREMELTIEKRVTESQSKLRESAKKEAEEQLGLKVIERDQIIESLQHKIEDLKKKAEQGSQQLQGEAMEIQLEGLLGAKFPYDTLTPVPKGEHGGDILQKVITPTGTGCGTILWETKRTKNWSNGWLSKLREDQRQAKAEIAVIVSAVLPEGVESFDQVESIWVVHPQCVVPVAMSLRQMLMEVSRARSAGEGQQTKQEMMYHYLTGPKFRLRVQAIVEAFTNMNEDLTKEKKAIQKQWAKRQEQLERVIEATVGMYGELQGIAGKSLEEIEGLALPSLSSSTPVQIGEVVT